MRIEERNLPASPSNTATVDGQSENRRVELQFAGGDVLQPVVIDDTLRRATPPVIRFRSQVTAEAGVASWEIATMQDERLLKRLTGSGEVPEVVDWTVDEESETMPRAPGRIFYHLTVTDLAGQVKETTAEAIGVEQVTLRKKRNDRVADVEIRRYSLILFGYDESQLSEEHRKMLQEIGREIAGDARVIIRGYADRTGEDERNRTLSRERAETVAKALGIESDRLEVSGSTEPLYDNDIPEGRFYSRTVTIEVRTPVVDGDSG
jgi:outer membrane protein OmpA-like peptidoglycan-associated protein